MSKQAVNTYFSISLISALVLIGSTSVVSAARLDMATEGANYTAFSTLNECSSEYPNMGCDQLVDSCGGYAVYAPKFSRDTVAEVLQAKGSLGSLTISLMRPGGGFDKALCESNY